MLAQMPYCPRDECSGALSVTNDGGSFHLVCRTCGWASAGNRSANAPLESGERVRIRGTKAVGTVLTAKPFGDGQFVQLMLDDKRNPVIDRAAVHGKDGSVGFESWWLERVFP